MNSLAYISRQFDVLASVSTSGIRTAPPSPARSRRNTSDPGSSDVPSMSMPEIRTRRSSQPSVRARSKAKAFIQGPRRKAIASVDPVDIPLPPSPSASTSALPEPSSWIGSQEFLLHRSSPSPVSRKRRRRRTLSYIVLRPFIGVWHLLLSAWLWLIGQPITMRRRRPSGIQLAVAGAKLKQAEKQNSLYRLGVQRVEQREDQSDDTLVDSEDEERLSMATRGSRRRLSSSIDEKAALPGSDPDSFATSASILIENPPMDTPPSILRQGGSAGDSSSSTGRIRVSLPPFANMMGGSFEGNRGERRKLTPFPSRERIGKQEIEASPEDVDDDAEVASLLRRRKPSSSSSSTGPKLGVVDLNVPSPFEEDDKSTTLPRTIITPPSLHSITSPEAKPSIELPSASADVPVVPASDVVRTHSQTLLPNRLGTSYLTSAPRKGSNRSSPDHTAEGLAIKRPVSAGASGRGPTPFHRPKTLVLDLDETLIHSTSSRSPLPPTQGSGGVFNELNGLFIGGGSGGGSGLFSSGLLSGVSGAGGLLRGGDRARTGHMVEVVLNGRSTLYTVYKRPFVDYFLRKVSGWYTLVVFTASMQEYADPVIDWLDGGRGILSKRLFRESCTQLPNGSYAKDLSQVDPDLSRICLLDNSPISYSLDQANGIPIEGWYSDPSDEALLDLLPVLDSLRFTKDVRRVLGIKSF